MEMFKVVYISPKGGNPILMDAPCRGKDYANKLKKKFEKQYPKVKGKFKIEKIG